MKSKRLKFFTSHLIISIIVALIFIGVVFFVWYPSPLAKTVGVTHIFLMMLAIDVAIGPLLGFIVYKEGKKTLKFDLSVIILIQISALFYGVYSIAQGRPSWIVYTIDRFELVRNNEIILDHIDKAQNEYKLSSWLHPEFVAVEKAKNINQRKDDLFAEALGGISLSQRPERYVPLEQVKPQMQQRSQNFELLNQFNNSSEVDTILSKYPQATAWLPLKASAVDMVVLLDRNSDVVKIVDLRPWK